MNVVSLQIILLAFALLMIYSIFLHWKRKEISGSFFFFWLLIFVIFIILSVFPKFFELLIGSVFVVKIMDVGMIGAFMILTYFTVENNIRLKELKRKTDKLVRKISLTRLKKS